MKVFLTNTFSPQMLGEGVGAVIAQVSLETARGVLEGGFTSAVSHDVTAQILSALLGVNVPFNRSNLVLKPKDAVVAIIPSFRPSESREFTREEVEAAGFRCFYVTAV